jgi:hypothetical protein
MLDARAVVPTTIKNDDLTSGVTPCKDDDDSQALVFPPVLEPAEILLQPY